MSRGDVFSLVGFQLVWLISAIGAARGLWWPGPVAAVVFMAAYLLSRAAGDRRRMEIMILISGALGFCAESLVAATDLVRYEAAWPSAVLAPAWIVGLWLVFPVTLAPTRMLLGEQFWWKSAALGAALGPLSYMAGASLGALSFAMPAWPGYVAIALVWGLSMPLLLIAHAKGDTRSSS
jgi:hypothetical protein